MSKEATTEKVSVTEEMLEQQAARLARALRILREHKPEINSDELWARIKEKWYEHDLFYALAIFEVSGTLSPFLELYRPLPKTDAQGFIQENGKRWGSVNAFSQAFQIPKNTLASRITLSEVRYARGPRGIVRCYAESEVQRVCAEDLNKKSLPKANAEGTFKIGEEIWAVRETISRIIGLSLSTVDHRTKDRESMSGVSASGKICAYYRVSEIKAACADLLDKKLHAADKDGTVTVEGEVWAPMYICELTLGITHHILRKHLDGCRTRRSKDRTGHVRVFYAVPDLRKSCAHLLDGSLKMADAEGMIIHENERWATVEALTDLTSVSPTLINGRKQSYRSIQGKDRNYVIRTFYAVADVTEACKAQMVDIPQASTDGIIKHKGRTWGTWRALEDLIGIGRSTIEKNMRGKYETLSVKTNGRIVDFYSLTDAKSACGYLLKNTDKQTDTEGFLTIDSVLWGTPRAISKKLGVNYTTLGKRLVSFKHFLRGKGPTFRPVQLYPYTEVQTLCADLVRETLLRTDRVTQAMLDQHASVLARVLRAVRKQGADVVSDQLWRAITRNWSATKLSQAITTFSKTESVRAFLLLLRSASPTK